jgi:hypothetical protein
MKENSSRVGMKILLDLSFITPQTINYIKTLNHALLAARRVASHLLICRWDNLWRCDSQTLNISLLL